MQVQNDYLLDLFYCSFLFLNGFLHVTDCTYTPSLGPPKLFLSN